jgi:hypothetical protein
MMKNIVIAALSALLVVTYAAACESAQGSSREHPIYYECVDRR